MVPATIPHCCADVRLNSANFAAGLFFDPKTGIRLDGWRDRSGFGNHMVLRSGTVGYDIRDGVEGLVLDGTVLVTMRQYLMMGAGTLSLAFSGGVLANNTRDICTIEAFDATTTRTGNPAYGLRRFVGSGNNRTTWGNVNSNITVNLGGASTGDDTVQRAAYACDMKSTRGRVYGKLLGQSVVSAFANKNALIAPRGADLVFGRIDPTVTDAARTPLTGDTRVWISHVQQWGNFQTGNLIEDRAADLEALLAAMV